MAEDAKWYVVHTYSGYENTVSASILKSAENRHMEDLILEVKIPTESVTEHTDNGDKTYERKIFPGYVLVKMILTDDTWHLIRNARGSTGFVSMDGKPVPLTEEEVLSLGMERHEVIAAFNLGDTVKVMEGPLEGFLGTVDELEPEKDRVRVIISMFGRETPVDLDLDQVEPVKED
ncbi:MAG: transcription termination/antitermination protein NusG [Oscillospiraceae bacterium]|nr:transcription termination/antitermination protein NusG [Oscillospiraceae bacterium]